MLLPIFEWRHRRFCHCVCTIRRRKSEKPNSINFHYAAELESRNLRLFCMWLQLSSDIELLLHLRLQAAHVSFSSVKTKRRRKPESEVSSCLSVVFLLFNFVNLNAFLFAKGEESGHCPLDMSADTIFSSSTALSVPACARHRVKSANRNITFI